MTVFKTCLLILKRRFATMIIYFAIFLALCIIMPLLMDQQQNTDFSAWRPNFTLINRDVDSPISEGLRTFLAEYGEEIVLEDRKDVLQDASFYKATDCIIIIPDGFHKSFVEGAASSGLQTMETVFTTESAVGYYVDMLANRYLNQARIHYSIAGEGQTEQELISAVLSDLANETQVETMHFGTGAPVDPMYHVYNRMLSYILIIMIILCVSNITSSFRRPDIRMRNLCTPLKLRSMSFQQILCGVLVSLAAWILINVLGAVMYGGELGNTDWRIIALILLNTFVLMLLALSISSLAGNFIRSADSQNAIANILSLGLCFLGGTFVPLALFGEELLTVAQFTPVYWYTSALESIVSLNTFEAVALAPIWQAMLTQLIFAAAFFCLSLVISKRINQSERSFVIAHTELEA